MVSDSLESKAKAAVRAMDQGKYTRSSGQPRATRCQLLWALLFLLVGSMLGWFVIARLLF